MTQRNIVIDVDELQALHDRIAVLEKRVNALQELHPHEYAALWDARYLPHSGVHSGHSRAPGMVEKRLLEALIERGLLEANPERSGFYILSAAGIQLMGETEA